MACKYKYKGKWYSEDDLKSIIGNEFFNKELYEIREFEGANGKPGGFTPIRNLSTRKIFGDDLESMMFMQRDVSIELFNLIYIGSNISKRFLDKDRAMKKRGKELGIDLVYVPETLNVTVKKIHDKMMKSLKLYEAKLERGEILTNIENKKLQAYSHLTAFSKFKSMVTNMYPEGEALIREQAYGQTEDRVEDSGTASINPDIQESDRIDREKSQSKYVKFLTSFIDYTVGRTDGEGTVTDIIKNNKFVYKVLLDALTKPIDSKNLKQQLGEAFSNIIDINVVTLPPGTTPRISKMYGIYWKFIDLLENQDSFRDVIKPKEKYDKPILRNSTFNNEDIFYYDPRFGSIETNTPLHKVNIAERYKGIKNIKRKPDETTLKFLERIKAEVNKNLPEGVRPTDMSDLRDLWLFHYNKWILQDTVSLLTSQRDNSPFIYETQGKYGEITVKQKLQSSGISSYSLKTVLANNMATFFRTKENINKFQNSEEWQVIRKNLSDPKESLGKQKAGIRTFLNMVLDQENIEEISAAPDVIRTLSRSILYLVDNFLNGVEVDEAYIKKQAEREVNQDESLQEDFVIPTTSYDIITDNANSMLNTLSEIMEGEGEFNVAPLARAADGTSYHPYSNSSYAETLHDIIFFKKKGILKRDDPSHFDNIREFNPLINGRIRVGRLRTYKGNKYYNSGVNYKNEKANHWFLREFSGGFIDAILRRTKGEGINYDFYYPPISNKPNIKSVELGLQNKNNILESINDILKFINSRDKDLESVIKNFKKDKNTLFNVFSKGKSAQGIYTKLIDKSISSAIDFVLTNELHITKQIEKAEELLSKNYITEEFKDDIFKALSKRDDISNDIKKLGYLPSVTNFNFGKKEVDNQNKSSKDYSLTIDKFISMYTLYFLNNYVNTFFVGHAITGDPSFYKNENDYIKRLSGAFSPGTKMIVNEDYGISETFNALILKEDTMSKEVIDELIKAILPTYSEEDKKKLLDSYAKDFDRSDAQGIVLEKRIYDLQNGLGQSFGQGTAVKGQLFTNRKENINGKTHIIPTMLKYASLGLKTEDLNLAQYPKAKKLIRFMMDNKIDEIIFESGIKVGAPQKQHMYAIGDILGMNESSQEWVELSNKTTERNIKGDKRFSLLTLPNEDYRIQQNPNTNKMQEKKINTPTQALYVLNIAANGNEKLASQIYESFGKIYNLQSEDLYNAVNGKISSEFMSKTLAKKLVGENNDVFGYFLDQGINVNFPAFYQKATIMFASAISEDVLSTPFEGGKFQLVSDTLFDVEGATEGERRRLEIKKDKNGNVYAEVLVNRKYAEKFPLNTMGYVNGFTVRIPTSGLHSTLPFKIVGYIDEDSDVFVGPAELVPIQGSDFDADAVFAIRDTTVDDFLKRVSRKLNKRFYKGFKTLVENFYNDRDSESGTRVLFGYEGSELESLESIQETFKNILPKDTKEEDIDALNKQLEIFYHKQKIVKNIKDIISSGSNENVAELISPINMSIINGNTGSAYEYIAAERGVSIDTLKENLDLGDPQYKYAYYKRNFDGNMLTGIFANLFKTIAYADKAGESLVIEADKSKGIKRQVLDQRPFLEYKKDAPDESKLFIGETQYHQMQESTTFLGDSVYVRALMATLVNLAIDNVKEQGLPTINGSSTTAAAYVMGLSLGIPLEDMIGLMISPMGERISFFRTKSKVREELEALIKEDMDYDNINTLIPITKELLKKQIKYNKKNFKGLTQQELKEQLSLFKFYSKLDRVADPINKFSRYLSVLQDMKVNFKDIDDITSYFDSRTEYIDPKSGVSGVEMHDNDASDYKFNLNETAEVKINMVNFYKKNPHIYEAVASQKMMHKYITETLHAYTQDKQINKRFNLLQANLSNGVKKDRLDYVRKEFMHFIASTVDVLKPIYDYRKSRRHPEYNYQLTDVDAWAFDLADRLEVAIHNNRLESMKNNANKFLSHLQVNKKAGGGDRVISFSNPSKTEDYWLLHRDFSALDPVLQQDLLLYAIMFNGSKFGTSNFVLAIPPYMYREFSKQYNEALNKAINGSEEYKDALLDRFELQMMVNSTSFISSFNSNVLTYSNNESVTLTNGNKFYFDMYHDNETKPDLFQVDTMNEQDETNPDDRNVIENTEEEIKDDRLLKGSNSRYVVSRGQNKVYTLYRRIDGMDLEMFPIIKDNNGNIITDMRNNTYYKKVATVKRSKYYTFTNPEAEFQLDRAFSPQFPVQAVPLQYLSSTEPFTVTTFQKPSYEKGQNVIGYSNLNPERMDGVTLFVKDIVQNNKTLLFEVTFTISNNSLPLFSPEDFYRPSQSKGINLTDAATKAILLLGGSIEVFNNLQVMDIVNVICN